MSQLTNYIQKELDRGFSKDLITEKLVKAGYSKDEINESFKSLKSAEPLLRRKVLDTIHEDAKVLRSKWLFPVLGILVLIGLVYLVFQYVQIPITGTSCDAFLGNQKDICYLELAATGEDVCEKINLASIKLACTEKLWQTEKCIYERIIDNLSVACKLPADCTHVEDYSGCISDLALEQQNIGLCDGNMRCITKFAIQMKDGSLCNTLNGGRDYCASQYYQATGDAQYCVTGDLTCGYSSTLTDQEKIAFFEKNVPAINENGLNDYLLEFAGENNEPLVCQYLKETDTKIQEILDTYTITTPDFCIIMVAYKTENSAICEMLTETNKYSLCIDTLSCTEGELCNEIQ